MAGIIVSIGIRAKEFSAGLKRISKRLGRWAKSIKRIGFNAGRMLINGMRRASMVGIGAVGAIIAKGLTESGRFEKFELQFKALLGSVGKAKARMDEMKKLDLEVPFDITDLMDASRVLTVFTEDAFAGIDAMRMMADAAAVTPNNIKEVAFWYGRAYSMIKAGRPFGEAAMRLQEMGLLSGSARNEIERLAKGGKGLRNLDQIMAVLNAEFKKFEGAAGDLTDTWVGQLSVFSSATRYAFAAVGDAIMPLAKTWLKELTEKLKQLEKNGTLKAWGQNISTVLKGIRDKVENDILPAFSGIGQAIQESIDGRTVSEALKEKLTGIGQAITDAFWKAAPDAAKIGYEVGQAFVDGFLDATPGIGGLREFTRKHYKLAPDLIGVSQQEKEMKNVRANLARYVFQQGGKGLGVSDMLLSPEAQVNKVLEQNPELTQQIRDQLGGSLYSQKMRVEVVNWEDAINQTEGAG